MSISKSELWAKENALNLAISRLPSWFGVTFYRDFLDLEFKGLRRREQIIAAAKVCWPNRDILGIISSRLTYIDRVDGWFVQISYREKVA